MEGEKEWKELSRMAGSGVAGEGLEEGMEAPKRRQLTATSKGFIMPLLATARGVVGRLGEGSQLRVCQGVDLEECAAQPSDQSWEMMPASDGALAGDVGMIYPFTP